MRKLTMVTAAVVAFGAISLSSVPSDARDGRDGPRYNKHYSQGHKGGQRYWYRDGRRYDYNGAVAAGIIGGVAAGALLGGAARGPDAECTTTTRMYDEYTGTYRVVERTGPC